MCCVTHEVQISWVRQAQWKVWVMMVGYRLLVIALYTTTGGGSDRSGASHVDRVQQNVYSYIHTLSVKWGLTNV